MKIFNIFFALQIIIFLSGCDDQTTMKQYTDKDQQIHHDKKLQMITRKLATKNPESIQPYSENPKYWQYKGAPVILLGASDEDNLFNHPDIWPFGLESHLELMAKNGGNYLRNTMSSRDYGNPWPFRANDEGLYDLNIWNEEYWLRFENFLNMAYKRDIIVQIEIWDRFDYAGKPWSQNPFNPKNNVNYDSNESSLPEIIDTHPNKKNNAFFRTVPDLENNSLVLPYQKAFVEKILSITFNYPNILYCISNETNESPVWSDYWANFIHRRAFEKEKLVYVTEMKDAWNLSDPQHRHVLGNPDLYTYVDFSQNSHKNGQSNWDNAQMAWAQHLEKLPRPMNSVKIYSGLRFGGSFEEGTQKLWRNIFGGFASSRFHRTSNPFNPSGIGLSPLAQTNIRSMRMLTDEMNVFVCKPSNHLLSNREPNEAYAFVEERNQYSVYFPNGGAVKLNLSNATGKFFLRWLNIMVSEWQKEEFINGGKVIDLSPPSDGPWAVLIKKG